jgi:isoleucyl-tRNA synthetase
MAAARELASLGHSARSEARVKVRQPLSRAVLLVPFDLRDAVEEVAELLADELNVKELSFADEVGALVRVTLRPNYPVAGPEFGARVPALARALQALDVEGAEALASSLEEGEEIDIDTDEGPVRVNIEYVEIRREPAEGTAFAYESPFGVSLDLEVTPELRREGLAREFVHQLQAVRRELGLDVTDRVAVVAHGPDDVLQSLREHSDFITDELLASSLDLREPEADQARVLSLDDAEIRVGVRKA